MRALLAQRGCHSVAIRFGLAHLAAGADDTDRHTTFAEKRYRIALRELLRHIAIPERRRRSGFRSTLLFARFQGRLESGEVGIAECLGLKRIRDLRLFSQRPHAGTRKADGQPAGPGFSLWSALTWRPPNSTETARAILFCSSTFALRNICAPRRISASASRCWLVPAFAIASSC